MYVLYNKIRNEKKCAIICEINSCRNRCLFCNPTGYRTNRVIDKQELRDIETQLLTQAIGLNKKGYDTVEISGCDPIKYEKIARFITILKSSLNFKTVILSTHGRNLDSIKFVKKIKKSGLDELRIPLYGAKASVHDSITQEKGSFKETLSGIKNVKKYEPLTKITLTTLVMKQNYKSIPDISLLEEIYALECIISIPCVSHHENAKNL